MPFGCAGAKSLGYALSHAVRIIAKECFHQQSPTLFGRYVGGKDRSDFLASLLKHGNDVCLTLVENCLVLYLCISWIGIAEKIEVIVCALLYYTSIVMLLYSLAASLLLLSFELEISLCRFSRLCKNISHNVLHRFTDFLCKGNHISTEFCNVSSFDGRQKAFRKINTRLIGHFHKVKTHILDKVVEGIALTCNGKVSLLHHIITLLAQRFNEEFLFTLIKTHIDRLLHLSVNLAVIVVVDILKKSIGLVLLLLQMVAPFTHLVVLLPTSCRCCPALVCYTLLALCICLDVGYLIRFFRLWTSNSCINTFIRIVKFPLRILCCV